MHAPAAVAFTAASNPGDLVSANTRGTSGNITSTRDPRNIQLSMKLYF